MVAVSGGVDSMVLLDLLAGQKGLELVVAHVDHGIRPESYMDRRLVEGVAGRLGLRFVYNEAQLGPKTSEATARDARYAFLRRVQEQSGAQAIVTAHHQDDLVETALLNLLRGTGRKGLTSLGSSAGVIRPLLHTTKKEILDYATAHQLQWREDSTNADERYLRNYLRNVVLPKASEDEKARLLQHLQAMQQINTELDQLLINALHVQPALHSLDRHWFIMLPYAVSAEVMAAWLRQNNMRSFDKKLINRLVVAAKTLQPGKVQDITSTAVLKVYKSVVQITPRSSS